MIAFLKGIVEDITENSVILDVNGVGYQVFISSREVNNIQGVGKTIKIHTYLDVKEDSMHLFGFLSRDDLDMYRLLVSVSGIGPKAAMGILSALTSDDIRFAVLSEDAKTISKAPGVGMKTAKKMILELKDKLSLEDAFEKKLASGGAVPAADNMSAARNEAIQALTALGYSNSDALRAINKAEISDEMDTETILKLALKKMAFL